MSWLDYIIKKIEQAESLLYSFRHSIELLPFILMVINCIVHCVYINLIWDFIIKELPVDKWTFPNWFFLFHSLSRFWFETSFVTWLILIILSRNWRKLSKYSLRFMFVFLAINFYFIITDTETIGNLYFYSLLSILFVAFFLFSIFVMSKYN